MKASPDAAGLVLVGGIEGLEPTKDELSLISDHGMSGVTLFRRNIPQEQHIELLRFTKTLQEARPNGSPNLVIAVDQEGGRVSRFGKTFPNMGPALDLVEGRIDLDALTIIEDYGRRVGQALKTAGVNINFAPVLDVLTNLNNHAIGNRVFGLTVEQASLRARAFLEGLQSAGVLGCLKHFPGQGDAAFDTHYDAAEIQQGLQQLWNRELAPFRALMPISKLVMMSHCIYPSLDQNEASRSEIIIERFLKSRLGFNGVIVSDDMVMQAIPQADREWQEAIVEAVAAGCDMLLVCRHVDRQLKALEALRRESQRSFAFSKRLHVAATKVHMLRQSLIA
jgi:beta-N-acetylhexosaminidase